MKIVLFVNDSYFAYLLARPVIEKFHDKIEAVFFSSKIKGSASKIMEVFKKTHWRYFAYRAFVDLISRFNTALNRKTVSSQVRQYGLKIFTDANINKSASLDKILPADLGLAFNFDQIIKNNILNCFEKGVINVHSSRLPRDKGISPVLWAFSRGDKSIWSTIYKIDKGIDAGLVYKQFEIPVENNDTAFSLYERVCKRSGYELVETIDSLIKGSLEPISQSKDDDGNYWGWPDIQHKKMMKKSKRTFIDLRDILRALRKD
jgi:methionyl-tRNA formyltransferase